MATAIISRLPNAMVMRNQIPKEYVSYDCYSNLIPNDDPQIPYYQMVPRIGAFEVSHQGVVVFSKYVGNYWPNCQTVADKCKGIVDAILSGQDTSMFLAGNVPLGDGTYASQKSLNTKASQKSLKPNRSSLESLHNPKKSAAAPKQAAVKGQIKAGSHVKTIADLSGFPVFPPGTKSLLSKYLTP